MQKIIHLKSSEANEEVTKKTNTGNAKSIYIVMEAKKVQKEKGDGVSIHLENSKTSDNA
jgi:hypothetical protein